MKKSILALPVLAAGLLTSLPHSAQAFDTQNALRDERGSFIRATDGGCVRTKWMSLSDPCAPPAPQMAAIPLVFRTFLREDTRTVHFDFDEYYLTPDAQYKLTQLAEILKNSRDIRRAEIVGHTDRMGDGAYNMELSRQRANAVENFLNRQGYWNTSVSLVRGVGETAAFMDCKQYASRDQKILCNSNDRKTVVDVVYGQNELVQQAAY